MMMTLAKRPKEATVWLKGKLQKAQGVPDKKIQDLIADLAAEDFTKRSLANAELIKLGDIAEAVLREALKRNSSLEAKRRIQALLEALESSDRQFPSPSTRIVRSLQVLEAVDTVEAWKLVEELAQGDTRARQTRYAKAALERRKQSESSELQGTWTMVSHVVAGQEAAHRKSQWVFAGSKVTISGGDVQREGTFTLDPKSKLKSLDLLMKQGAQPTPFWQPKNGLTEAIYRVDGDLLMIAYPIPPNQARPTKFWTAINIPPGAVIYLQRYTPAKSFDARIHWGEPVEGLQAGISLAATSPRVFRIGDTLTMAFSLRNVGDKALNVKWEMEHTGRPSLENVDEFLFDSKGQHIPVLGSKDSRPVPQTAQITLAPGEGIEFGRLQLEIASVLPKSRGVNNMVGLNPGKYSIRIPGVAFMDIDFLKQGDKRLFVSTSKIEFEVTDAPK